MLRDSADAPPDMLPAAHSDLNDLEWGAIRAYWSLYDGSHATGGIRKMSDTDFLCHMGAAVMDGEYGMKDVALSIPRMISQDGIVRSFEVRLPDDEMEKLLRSQKSVRAALDGAGVK